MLKKKIKKKKIQQKIDSFLANFILIGNGKSSLLLCEYSKLEVHV